MLIVNHQYRTQQQKKQASNNNYFLGQYINARSFSLYTVCVCATLNKRGTLFEFFAYRTYTMKNTHITHNLYNNRKGFSF